MNLNRQMTLACQWPGSKGVPIEFHDHFKRFTIHGPRFGIVGGDPFLGDFDHHVYIDPILLDKLKRHWPNLHYHTRPNHTVPDDILIEGYMNFWRRQWMKHGRDQGYSPNVFLEEVVNFFIRNLAHSPNLSLNLGAKLTVQQARGFIKSAIGTEAMINVGESKDNQHYLVREVVVGCSELEEGVLVDAPFSVTGAIWDPNSKKDKIILPDCGFTCKGD